MTTGSSFANCIIIHGIWVHSWICKEAPDTFRTTIFGSNANRIIVVDSWIRFWISR